MLDDRIAHLFETVLPAALQQSGPTPGSVAVLVEGAGAWTVRLGEARVERDVDLDADCTAVFTLAAFRALLDGERRPDKTRPVALVGDPRMLERLGALLVPAQRGGVAARLASLNASPPPPRAAV